MGREGPEGEALVLPAQQMQEISTRWTGGGAAPSQPGDHRGRCRGRQSSGQVTPQGPTSTLKGKDQVSAKGPSISGFPGLGQSISPGVYLAKEVFRV